MYNDIIYVTVYICINNPFSAKVEFSAGAKVVDTLPLYTYTPNSENPNNFRVESLNKKLKTPGTAITAMMLPLRLESAEDGGISVISYSVYITSLFNGVYLSQNS